MNKKLKLVIVMFLPIFLFILIVSIYELTADKYIIQKSISSISVKGNTYYPTAPEWSHNMLGKRIGYIKSDNTLPSITYIPFKHGIYSLKNDPSNMFYKIEKLNASKDYVLFVRHDVDLEIPIDANVLYMKNERGKVINDEKIIKEFFKLFYSNSDDVIQTPLVMENISIFVKDYTSIHYEITMLRDINDVLYVVNPLHGYHTQTRIPKELATIIVGD